VSRSNYDRRSDSTYTSAAMPSDYTPSSSETAAVTVHSIRDLDRPLSNETPSPSASMDLMASMFIGSLKYDLAEAEQLRQSLEVPARRFRFSALVRYSMTENPWRWSEPEPQLMLGHVSSADIDAAASVTGAFGNQNLVFEPLDD
jgi:hypothetical protein